MRQMDEASAEVKKLQVHSAYLEGAKGELEVKLVEKQRELDASNRERRIMEARVADVRAENEMLYASEERVKRLMEEIEQLKGQGRMRDKDIELLNQRNATLMDENM